MAHALTVQAPVTPRHLGRSTGAVFAGLVAVVIPSIATDALMHTTGVFPEAGQVMTTGLFALALWYPLALVVSSIPFAWAGGKLHVARTRR